MLKETESPIAARPVAPAAAVRTRVLTLLSPYLPGYRSGGPVQSMSKTIQVLARQYEFFVLTNDRDHGDTVPYPGVPLNTWQKVQEANVYYAPKLDLGTIERVIGEVEPDVLYLHSYYDALTLRALYLRKMGKIRPVPVVLAPRGEFSSGAMSLKSAKKRLFRQVSRMTGLHDGVVWHASSTSEMQDLQSAMGDATVFQAHIPAFLTPAETERIAIAKPDKKRGHARLIFAARICPMKNLLYLIESLAGISGEVELEIFGPVESRDETYWQECKARIEQLPRNIRTTYRGGVPHLDLLPALRSADFFVLPTLGENFCHSIAESFLCGTPVIISDRTPWRKLRDANVGFDLPLETQGEWTRTLQRCIDMDNASYGAFEVPIQRYMAERSIEESVRQFNTLFTYAMRKAG